MADKPTPIPQAAPIQINIPPTSSPAATSSLWDRISTWASENKALVYSLAGVTVVVTGGAVYYYSTSKENKSTATASGKKKSKKDKRKAKKDAEAGEAAKAASEEVPPGRKRIAEVVERLLTESTEPKKASVETEEELPQVTEESVASLSQEVYSTSCTSMRFI